MEIANPNHYQYPFRSVEEEEAAYLLREYLLDRPDVTNPNIFVPIEENMRKPKQSIIALVKKDADYMRENDISPALDYQALVDYLESIDDYTYMIVRDEVLSWDVHM